MLNKILAAVAAAAALLISGACFAGTVGGSTVPFGVGVYRTTPSAPAIAASARGDIAVVWADLAQDGTQDVFFSHLPIGTWHDNPATHLWQLGTAGNSVNPVVAMSAIGDFVIAWQGDAGIHALVYSNGGVSATGIFQVNEFAGDSDEKPAVAMDAFGNFVVVWRRNTGSASSIVGRRFAVDGTAISGDFQVDDAGAGINANPAVAMAASGQYVVAWEAGDDVQVKSFATDGTPDAPQAPAAGFPAQSRRSPSVGMDAFGRFVVGWNNTDLAGTSNIQARQFFAGGSPAGMEFVVNLQMPSDPAGALALAVGATGTYAVAWEGQFPSNDAEIFKQQFAADGTRLGAEERAEYGYAGMPALAVDADGDAYAAYHWFNRAESKVGVRRFTGPELVDLSVSVTDRPDPTATGQAMQYAITVTNHHAASAQTGIAEVDAGIGYGDYELATMDLTGGMSFFGIAKPCFQWNSASAQCNVTGIPAGGAVTQIVQATAPGDAGQASLTTSIHAFRHVDPVDSNNSAVETTTIGCPVGGEGAIVVAAAPSSVSEGGSFVVQVERVNGTCGFISVGYGTENGGADFATANGTLYWFNGEGGTRDIVINTMQDSIDEDPQTIQLYLDAPTGGAVLGTPSAASISIIDDDAEPTVSITGPLEKTVTEGVGTRVDFTLALSGFTEKQVAVPLTFGGTAGSSDYSAASVVAFGGAQQQQVSIDYHADADVEHDETVVLTLGEPANATLVGPAVATLIIKDNSPPPAISFMQSSQITREGSGVSVALTAGLSAASVHEVRVLLSPSGTAARGTDWSMAGDWLVIPAGARAASKTVQVLNNGVIELDEQVTFTMGSFTNAVAGATLAHTLTIKDNDPEVLGAREAMQDAGGP